MQLPLFYYPPIPFFNLIVLNPDKQLTELVASWKTEVQDLIVEEYESLYSKAHLTLMSLKSPETWNCRINEAVKAAGLSHQPILFETESLNFFENAGEYVIYIAVNNQPEFNLLQERLRKEHVYRLAWPKTKHRHLPNVPHITIARGLSQSQFDTVWPTFRFRDFHHSFVANSITLLRKSESVRSKIVGEFSLGR